MSENDEDSLDSVDFEKLDYVVNHLNTAADRPSVNNSSESSVTSANPFVKQLAENAARKTLPKKSTSRYELAFKKFQGWQSEHQILITDVSETTMLAYFNVLSSKHVPSSLWCIYSMLRKMILLNFKVDISKYFQLNSFIKTENSGYVPTKANVFTQEQTQKFLDEASKKDYLLHKVS